MRALGLACAALLACDHSKEATVFLQDNGYTEIVLTPPSGDTFTFTAKNDAGQHCHGKLDVDEEDESSHSAICAWECTKKDWKGCHALGQVLEASSVSKALDAYATGCEAGDGTCCARAGFLYDEGRRVSKDIAKAFLYDKKACDLGDGQGCASVAIGYDQGIGTTKDPAAAFRAADVACTQKLMIGCKIAGSALLTGSGVPRDVIGGSSRLERACKSGESFGACGVLGRELVAGHFMMKNVDRGAYLLHDACTNRDASACHELGRLLADKTLTDTVSPSYYFRQACDLGDAPSCQKLAMR